MRLKFSLASMFGVIGSCIASLLGGWDTALQTLIIYMAIDYVSGLVVAAVFHKSKKSENGALNSSVGWKGLCKKGMTLLIVLIAARLDLMSGSNIFRNAAIIGYIINETISITENAALMGLPLPDAIKKGIDILQKNQGEVGQ